MFRWFAALMVVLALGQAARAEEDVVYNQSYVAVTVRITHEIWPFSWQSYLPAHHSDIAPLDAGPRRIAVFLGRGNQLLATGDFLAHPTGSRTIKVIQTTNNTFRIQIGEWEADSP
jgi:hypothetical protein